MTNILFISTNIIGYILFFCIIFTGLLILSKKIPAMKGAHGEKLVKKALNQLDNNYKVFHDIYVPNERGTTQIDHIVTSSYGIFVIETKHYNGWIYGSENQKYWTQVIYRRKERFYNPIWQNYGHIQSLKKYFEKEEFENVYSIIAFSNQSTLKFKENFKSAQVVHIPKLVNVIKEKNEVVLKEEELEEINNKLEQLSRINKSEKKEIKKQHVHQVRKNVKEQKINELKRTRNNLCPKCDGELQIRKGKYGAFYGCSNYPRCKYTEKID